VMEPFAYLILAIEHLYDCTIELGAVN